jgi:hypothetical protein
MNTDEMAKRIGARLDMLVGERMRIKRMRDTVIPGTTLTLRLRDAEDALRVAERALEGAREAL